MDIGEQASQRFRLKTEAARERDVFRHLHPWTQEHQCDALHRNAFPSGGGGGGGGGSGDEAGEPTRAAEPCPDTAVVALAQLVALRLRVRRCFVTLVSSSVEYVLSEATRTSSLQYDAVEDVRDRPWLGTCSFLREEGMTGAAMDGWRRARSGREEPVEPEGFYYTEGLSPHYHIVSDVRREAQYAQHGFIRRSPKPGVRFYAAIPLRASTGSVLGSLAIVDDAPRFGLSAGELAFLEDVSDTISQHLDAVVVRAQRQRSERLIQSLGLFNSGKSSLRQWWLRQEDSRLATAGRHVKRRTHEQRKVAGEEEFGVQGESSSSTAANKPHDEVASASDSDDSQRGEDDPVTSTAATLRNGVAGRARVNAHVSTLDFSPTPQSPASSSAKLLPTPMGRPTAPRHTQTSSKLDGATFNLETACKRTYARASHLMRQALDADGVVFTNANIAHTKNRGNSVSPRNGSTDTSEKTGQPGALSDHDTSDGSVATAEKNCLLEAFSTKESSSLKDRSTTFRFDLSESYLVQLIRRHPNGKIWNFSQDGSCYSSSGEETTTSASSSKISIKKTRDGKRLGKIMPGAKTIAFFPISDEAQDRWISGVFVWSTSPHKYFDPSEDITYLASWSHSVLAELARLQTMASDKAKGSFISSISHELRSPLHGILAGVEFMEETELTAFQQEMSHTIRTAGKALLDTVDNILDYAKISSFTRAQSQQRISADASRYNKSVKGHVDEIGVTATVDLALLTEEVVETAVNAHRFRKTLMANADVPSVAINIERRDKWTVEIQPGSWTRILNNLVGNSLKYTNSGLISIRLESSDPGPDLTGWRNIRLIVQDTGIGMTKQFLARELYTPFKQADSHASGTGLGLSIVSRICKDSGAQLNITSEVGVGTRVIVDLRARFVEDSATPPFRGLNVGRFHWFSPDTPTPTPSQRSIASTVIETAQGWLDCETTQGAECEDDSGSVVYAIAEEDLSTWVSQQTPHMTASGTTKPSHVLVLGQSMQSVCFDPPTQTLPFIPIFIHQPVGPRKLLRAITADQSSTEMGHARPNRERPTLPGFDITVTSPPPTAVNRIPSAGYLPWDDKQNKQPRKLEQAAPENSTQRPTISSISSSTAPSVLHSPSDSIGSTSWQESVDENPPILRDTVLLVEDNEVNMKLLVALMRRLKHKFLCATNGREAVDLYREQPHSILLILMDISMPVMTGDVATAKIRETERRKRLPRVHIAALTGVTSEKAREVAMASGVDEFYSKPVTMRELKVLVGKFDGGREGH